MARISKDEQIIRDNPGLAPYELLGKGLSQKGYDNLIAATEKEKVAVDTAKAKEKVVVLSQPPASVTKIVKAGHNYLVDKKSGKATRMTYESAARWARKYPNQFKVQ